MLWRLSSLDSSQGDFLAPESEMFVDESFKTSTEAVSTRYKSKGIAAPHSNDVLMGRGGKNNQHSGNETLRKFARQRCEDYRRASKKGKSDISRELVRIMRELEPPARFLRKDAHTCKWEDVGDDIAREKTSQVLRDAVSEKNGPMAKSRTKLTPQRDISPSTEAETKGGSNREALTPAWQDQNEVRHARSKRPHTPREPRFDIPLSSCYYSHQYAGYTTSIRPSPLPHTPSNHSVTPATLSMARKRPRVSESPVSTYNYYSPSSSKYLTNTSPGIFFSSPAPRYQRQKPSPSYFSYTRSPASAVIPSHYASQESGGRNEPWLADVNAQFADSRLALPSSSDFDFYNEELLSDHSEHTTGSIFPFKYPKRDSL